MPWQVESSNGIFLPQIGWHLDAPRPAARSFVSHAHADHIARHRLVLCTPETRRLMLARMSGKRECITLGFGAEHVLEDGTRVRLHPAGHIFGSAQFFAENEHGTLLYTGDFKLRPGRTTVACTTPRADTLIMETTFGRPRYVFPSTTEIEEAIVCFCRETFAAGAVPVLFAYSLGKSQELLAIVGAAGLPVMLHAETLRLTRVHEQLGAEFPPHREFDAATCAGHVVITPPQANRSTWLNGVMPRRTAAVTGWALDSSTIYRQRCDAAFPLSDHAGFDDLLLFVERVQPRRVYTVHGFATEFASELRSRGIEAWALGRENQLDLDLGGAPCNVASQPPSL